MRTTEDSAGGARERLRVACVQLRGGREVAANIEAVTALVREAAAGGAELIVTPEQTALIELEPARIFANTYPEEDDPTLAALTALAAELGRWLVIGSIGIRVGKRKLANRSFVVDPAGTVVARYDKIHLFDVDLAGGESYRESNTVRPGDRAVMADLPWGRIGLSVCYDLRFAALYRTLAKAGARLLTVPAAFTRITGEAHWHTLVRARAIETGSFVLAPAHGGRHENGRETYGHSLIVSPWGEILAEAGIEPGVIAAEIDPAEADRVRRRIPSLHHDRPFSVVQAGGAGAVRAAS